MPLVKFGIYFANCADSVVTKSLLPLSLSWSWSSLPLVIVGSVGGADDIGDLAKKTTFELINNKTTFELINDLKNKS